MAVAIQPPASGNNFEHAAAHELFTARFAQPLRQFSYLPSSDGQRFLGLVPTTDQPAAPPPLTVIVNWPQLLAK